MIKLLFTTILLLILGASAAALYLVFSHSPSVDRSHELRTDQTHDLLEPNPSPPLSLSLSPSLITQTLENPISRELTNASHPSKQPPSEFDLTAPPLSVELSEGNTPVVQYHFERKASVAEKADVQDQFDGLDLEESKLP